MEVSEKIRGLEAEGPEAFQRFCGVRCCGAGSSGARGATEGRAPPGGKRSCSYKARFRGCRRATLALGLCVWAKLRCVRSAGEGRCVQAEVFYILYEEAKPRE